MANFEILQALRTSISP